MAKNSTAAKIELVAGNMKGAMKNANATSADLWKVPREHIRVIPGFNVRNGDDPDYKAHIRWIADSIKANGFYADKPLAGYVAKEGDNDVIFLTDGHSRLAGADLAISEGKEIPSFPIVVKPRGTSIEDLTVALYTTNGGRPLTPYETGVVCKRLIDFGWEEKQIAERLGLTTVYVRNLLDLVGAPPEVRSLVTEGKVSATMAIQTMKDHGVEAKSILQEAVQDAAAAGKERATAKTVKKIVAKKTPEKPVEKAKPDTKKAIVPDTAGADMDADHGATESVTAATEASAPVTTPPTSSAAVETSEKASAVVDGDAVQAREPSGPIQVRGRSFTVPQIESLVDAAHDALDLIQELVANDPDNAVVNRLYEALQMKPEVRVSVED